MKLGVRNLCFAYTGKALFDNLSVELDGGESGRPLVILGPSGSGKTTLLKLLGGLLKPQGGEICFYGEDGAENSTDEETKGGAPKTAFIFQEPRLLPWLTVLENTSLPLKKIFGKEEACERARRFLSLVSLEDKEGAYAAELSGGQAQRVSMARAFAWPAPALFMDEPFQSLDIPLRINLMDLTLSLLEKEGSAKKTRLLIMVTHDPREAVYMGGRVIILGKPGDGIIFDRKLELPAENRVYGSAGSEELVREMIEVLRNDSVYTLSS
jgi:NitT/TauT family transport system ATP-binding protein